MKLIKLERTVRHEQGCVLAQYKTDLGFTRHTIIDHDFNDKAEMLNGTVLNAEDTKIVVDFAKSEKEVWKLKNK